MLEIVIYTNTLWLDYNSNSQRYAWYARLPGLVNVLLVTRA